jgi:hypothetical protein
MSTHISDSLSSSQHTNSVAENELKKRQSYLKNVDQIKQRLLLMEVQNFLIQKDIEHMFEMLRK